MRSLVLLCLASLSLHAQQVAKVAVVASSPLPTDSNHHVDVRVGAANHFTAHAYDAHGTLLTGRVFTWRTLDPNVATVSQGRVTGKAIGATNVVAATGGHAGFALACVVPDTVVRLPQVVVAGTFPTWTTNDSGPTSVRVELDATFQGISVKQNGFLPCTHWAVRNGTATPNGPDPRITMGHDGVITLTGGARTFYPWATVGPTIPVFGKDSSAWGTQTAISVTSRRAP